MLGGWVPYGQLVASGKGTVFASEVYGGSAVATKRLKPAGSEQPTAEPLSTRSLSVDSIHLEPGHTPKYRSYNPVLSLEKYRNMSRGETYRGVCDRRQQTAAEPLSQR